MADSGIFVTPTPTTPLTETMEVTNGRAEQDVSDSTAIDQMVDDHLKTFIKKCTATDTGDSVSEQVAVAEAKDGQSEVTDIQGRMMEKAGSPVKRSQKEKQECVTVAEIHERLAVSETSGSGSDSTAGVQEKERTAETSFSQPEASVQRERAANTNGGQRMVVREINGRRPEINLHERIVVAESNENFTEIGVQVDGSEFDLSDVDSPNIDVPVPVRRSSIASVLRMGLDEFEIDEPFDNPRRRPLYTPTPAVNVFEKYWFLVVFGIICAGVIITIGICHLVRLIVEAPLDTVEYVSIVLEISMIIATLVLLYHMYRFSTRKWVYNSRHFISCLLCSILNLSCPSMMLALEFDYLVVVALVSTVLFLFFFVSLKLIDYYTHRDL